MDMLNLSRAKVIVIPFRSRACSMLIKAELQLAAFSLLGSFEARLENKWQALAANVAALSPDPPGLAFL